MLHRRTLLAAGALASLGVSNAQDNAYPSKPIKWIVGYPAGGGSDFVARTLSGPLSQSLGQPVVIDNRAGAATIVAAAATKSSPADGYTIFSADLGTLVYNPLLYKKLPYDVGSDFLPVGLTVRYQFCLVCTPDFPARTVEDVVKQAKSMGAKRLDYASPGVGSTHQLTMEMFAQQAGIELVHTPYKGAAPALQDVMAGVVPLMMCDIASSLPLIKAGKLRGLAMASQARSQLLPDLPTFAEAGFRGIDTNSWAALVVPKGTPDAIVQRLSRDLRAAVMQADVQKKFMDLGVEPLPSGPGDVFAAVKADSARWLPVVKRLNISLEY